MKIGELARLTATPVETIRFYEREGLLPAAARTASNYRHYGAAQAERLTLIRRCRALDMNLQEIRALLALVDGPGEACDEVNALLDHHIAHVAQRLGELQALQQELLTLRARCAGQAGVAACGIVQGLREAEPATARQPGHPGGTHARRGAIP